MEYVDGATLSEIIKNATLDQKQACLIMLKVIEGLKYAHDNGIIHRDIKPSNIILTDKSEIKIMDFGLAKKSKSSKDSMALTATGDIIGTAHYMSPEQAKSKRDIDTRSDVFSLGATFYHILTGEAPFQCDNRIGLLVKVIEEKPKELRSVKNNIYPFLEMICLKCLEKIQIKDIRI